MVPVFIDPGRLPTEDVLDEGYEAPSVVGDDLDGDRLGLRHCAEPSPMCEWAKPIGRHFGMVTRSDAWLAATRCDRPERRAVTDYLQLEDVDEQGDDEQDAHDRPDDPGTWHSLSFRCPASYYPMRGRDQTPTSREKGH